MKTDKNSNEPSCGVPAVVVKEEPEAPDRVKIKEETGTGNNEETPSEDNAAECLKEAAALDAASVEGTIASDNQNGSGNQALLNSVKQESDPISAVEDLPTGELFTLCSCAEIPSNAVYRCIIRSMALILVLIAVSCTRLP